MKGWRVDGLVDWSRSGSVRISEVSNYYYLNRNIPYIQVNHGLRKAFFGAKCWQNDDLIALYIYSLITCKVRFKMSDGWQ